MSFVKFPSSVKPSRVTAQLQRADQMFVSPVTGAQQAASRGNVYWRHTVEYRDISEKERTVVQAFLMKAQGSLNYFKFPDFGAYEIGGDLTSDYADVFSNKGHKWTAVGSTLTKINSDYTSQSWYWRTITDDDEIRFEGYRFANPSVIIENTKISSLMATAHQGNAMYAHRIKFWQDPEQHIIGLRLACGSGGASQWPVFGAVGSSSCQSDGVLTIPYFTGYAGGVNPVVAATLINSSAGGNDDDGIWRNRHNAFRVADYYTARCALVCNSENLFTYSNNFGHANWTTYNASVASGWGVNDPIFDVNSGAWKLISDTSVNSSHFVRQVVTKNTSSDLWTFSVHAKGDELVDVALLMEVLDGATLRGYATAVFHLDTGTVDTPTLTNTCYQPSAAIYDCASGWYRCSLTALVGSWDGIAARVYLAADTDLTITGNGLSCIRR